jgi:hypothetical protein
LRASDSKLDPQIVRRAFAAGAFDKASVSTLPVMGSGGSPAIGVTIDSRFAKHAASFYASTEKFSSGGQVPSTAFDFAKDKMASQDSSVNKVAAVRLTTVAIGTPLILTAKEKKLSLPQSIAQAFDVYWVQFALNPRSDHRGNVDELSFFVSLKTADSEALELVPVRYGRETEVTSSIAVPSTEVKAGEIGLSIGEVYKQEVSYKALVPTIVGTGVQDSEFKWTMSDEMLDMSAKRLIAIVGVPKRTSRLDLEMIAIARTKPGWWVQGNVASSDVQKFSGKLPQ